MNREQFLPLIEKYLDLYYSIGRKERQVLLDIADIHRDRFLNEFIPFLESLLTISKNRWVLTDDSTEVMVQAGRKAGELAAQIVDLMTDWTIENFPIFYKAGLELWQINQEMLDEKPDKVKLTEEDIRYITNITGAETKAWMDHLHRHVRQIERYVSDGMARGWTTERFIELCTCPDGYIVDFLEGNSRRSWHEHLRRFGTGRPDVVAQTALERRGNK